MCGELYMASLSPRPQRAPSQGRFFAKWLVVRGASFLACAYLGGSFVLAGFLQGGLLLKAASFKVKPW